MKKVYHGIVKNRQVVIEEELDLPDGTAVEVRGADSTLGTAQAVLEALEFPPHLSDADVAELFRQIDGGRRPVRFETPLDG